MSGEDRGGGNHSAILAAVAALAAAIVTGIFVYNSSDLAAAKFVVSATQTAESAATREAAAQATENTMVDTGTIEASPSPEATVDQAVTATPASEMVEQVTRTPSSEAAISEEATEVTPMDPTIELTPPAKPSATTSAEISPTSSPVRTGGVVINALYEDGEVALVTTGVHLFPKTLQDDDGNLHGDPAREIFAQLDRLSATTEIKDLQPGRYIVCFSAIDTTVPNGMNYTRVNVGEIEIVPDQTKAEFLRWPAAVSLGDRCDL